MFTKNNKYIKINVTFYKVSLEFLYKYFYVTIYDKIQKKILLLSTIWLAYLMNKKYILFLIYPAIY